MHIAQAKPLTKQFVCAQKLSSAWLLTDSSYLKIHDDMFDFKSWIWVPPELAVQEELVEGVDIVS